MANEQLSATWFKCKIHVNQIFDEFIHLFIDKYIYIHKKTNCKLHSTVCIWYCFCIEQITWVASYFYFSHKMAETSPFNCCFQRKNRIVFVLFLNKVFPFQRKAFLFFLCFFFLISIFSYKFYPREFSEMTR